MGGDKNGVVLLNCWVSPFGARVRIALATKGVAYQETAENLADKGPLLLASNPVHKSVPVLLHDGKPICESLVIVEYIEEAWAGKGAPLLPTDPYARAQARFFANYIDTKVTGCAFRLWRTNGETLDEAKKEMLSILEVLEEELGDKAYFGGDTLGLADVALVPFTVWFHTYEQCAGFSISEAFPVLMAWASRCVQENESVAKSLPDPDKVYEFVSAMRKQFGLE